MLDGETEVAQRGCKQERCKRKKQQAGADREVGKHVYTMEQDKHRTQDASAQGSKRNKERRI